MVQIDSPRSATGRQIANRTSVFPTQHRNEGCGSESATSADGVMRQSKHHSMELAFRPSSAPFELHYRKQSSVRRHREHETSAGNLQAIVHSFCACASAKSDTVVRRVRSPEWQHERLCEGPVRALVLPPPSLKARSCPKSQPILSFDVFELLLDNVVDLGSLLAQMPELAP